MSLDPRAVAALGIGYGPLLIAYAGLWNVDAEVEGVSQEGGGADDVFDAPHKAYVKRIRKARLSELDAERKPEIEFVPVRTPEPVSEQRITLPDTRELADLADSVAKANVEVARLIAGAQTAARDTKQVVSRAAKRSIQRAARREAMRIENEDAEAIAIALALLED